MFGWSKNYFGISFPLVRNIGIKLELVTIRIKDIETMCDMVIGGSDDGHTLPRQFLVDSFQSLGTIANFESDMIETRFWYMTLTWQATDFNEEQFMMCSPRRKQCHPWSAINLAKPQSITIKIGQAFRIRNVEDKVTKFFDFHKYL